MSTVNRASRVLEQQQRIELANRQQVNFSPKKCWLCLEIFQLNDYEYKLIYNCFQTKNNCRLMFGVVGQTNDPEQQLQQQQLQRQVTLNRIRLIIINKKIVLTICKCRKKLAHVDCFNNYIDLKQKGNVTKDIFCSQCNFKYEFDYPYNNNFLKIFDCIDKFMDNSSWLISISLCVASAYWCCLTYGFLTVIQIYGYEDAYEIVKSSNKILLSIALPSIPIALVCARFIPWQSYIIQLFPNYLTLWNDESMPRRISQSLGTGGGGGDVEDEDDREDAQFLNLSRLVFGGLLLPTIVVALDRLCYFSAIKCLCKSTLARCTIVGFLFVGLKGACKIYCMQKKYWQQENRDIRNFIPIN